MNFKDCCVISISNSQSQSKKGGDLIMAKVLRCSDVGFECDGVIRAETEEEVMQQAAEHAKTAHDVQELTEEVVQKVKAAIQDE